MKIGEKNKTYKWFQVSSAQILLANGIRYLKALVCIAFWILGLQIREWESFLCLSPKGHLLQRGKGGSKCKDFSLWKNRIPSASQCSFLFVRKIFLSVSFLINALWTFHIVCFELESTLKGIYLPLKDLQEL